MMRELGREVWEPVGYHVVLRLEGDRPFATEAPELRLGARALYEVGHAYGLVAFRFADTHLHTVHACARDDAGRFARYAAASLRWRLRLRARFEASRLRPVLDRTHLYNTVRYVFRQEQHHGTSVDPDHDGSSLPELLGLRAAFGGAIAERVQRVLPRLTRRELLDILGAPALDVTPPCFAALGQAAAAAAGLAHLRGDDTRTVAARCAAIRVGDVALGTAAIASAIGITPRAVQRLRARPSDEGLVRAILLQLRLRGARAAASVAAARA